MNISAYPEINEYYENNESFEVKDSNIIHGVLFCPDCARLAKEALLEPFHRCSIYFPNEANEAN